VRKTKRPQKRTARKTKAKAKTKRKAATKQKAKAKRRAPRPTKRGKRQLRSALGVFAEPERLPDEADLEGLGSDLTVPERKFLATYIRLGANHGDPTAAYRLLHPKVTMRGAVIMASKLMTKIRATPTWQHILDLAGLSDFRLAAVVNRLLEATFIKPMVADKEIVEMGPYTDNFTRARAAELLARIRGRDVQRIAVDDGPLSAEAQARLEALFNRKLDAGTGRPPGGTGDGQTSK
jgi:hypothetical protein